MQFRKIFGKIAAAMLLPLSFQAVAAAGQPIYHQDFREFGENGSLPKSWDPNGDLRIVKIDGRMALAITGNGYAA